jgi:hypothetical protein
MSFLIGLLKRLETLESKLNGRNLIKVFVFHPEEEAFYWDSGPP